MVTVRPAGSSARAGILWSYGTHLLAFVISFGGIVLISRLLTERELGIYAVGFAILGILNVLSSFGVANYLIRDRERELCEGVLATCFTINALLGVAVAAAMFGVGTWGAGLFADPGIARVLVVLSLVPLCGIFDLVPNAMLMRDMRFGAVSLLQLLKGTVITVVMLACGYSGWSYLSPALGAAAGAAVNAVALTVVGWRYVTLRLSLRGGAEIARFTAHIVSAGASPLIAMRLAELVIAQGLGLAALGLYTRASGFAAMVWDYAYGLSTRVIFAQMARDLRERGSLRETFLHATRLLTAVFWPAMAGIAVLSGPLIHTLYGPRWDGAAWPLAILMASQAVGIGFAMTWELCVLTGRTGWQAKVEAGRAAAGLVAIGLGTLISLPAATLGRLVDALIGFAVYRPRLAEMSGASAQETRAAYSGNLLLTAVTIAPSVAVMALNGWSPATSPLALAGAIVAGGLCWLGMLARMRHPLFAEIRGLLPRSARFRVAA